MTEEEKSTLIQKALDARRYSYAPYSKFRVGAALLTAEGKIYQGCNIENVSYGATNCAERTALFKAVSEGMSDFVGIAICGGMREAPTDLVMPCGICRQVLAEFCKADMPVLLAVSRAEYHETTLGELLPFSFDQNQYHS